jgi:hypothetical protein
MRDALVGLLDKVDVAIAESKGVVSLSSLESVSRLADEARVRLCYPESVVVVALAGGTGSGKSSLLNAIVGDELALTGGLRPSTVGPLACVPRPSRAALDGYLDVLGVEERVDHDGPPWLCLIDLPDNDSVEVDHRHQTARLIPRVDMIVWVTDPEKYRDASLHRGSIAPVAAYQRQFVFVLNQIDRIDAHDVPVVIEDLVEALLEDGIAEPEIIVTAAQPRAGPPIGVDQVVERLERSRNQAGQVHRKLLTDLAAAASQLISSSSGAHAIEFERRWEVELVKKVSLALEGRVADAGHDLARFVTGLADEVDGETADRLRELAEQVPALVLECAGDVLITSAAGAVEPSPWWARLRGRADVSPEDTQKATDDMYAALDLRVGNPMRDLFAARSRATAAIADLALAVDHLERRTT